jgi:hypothetical protein
MVEMAQVLQKVMSDGLNILPRFDAMLRSAPTSRTKPHMLTDNHHFPRTARLTGSKQRPSHVARRASRDRARRDASSSQTLVVRQLGPPPNKPNNTRPLHLSSPTTPRSAALFLPVHGFCSLAFDYNLLDLTPTRHHPNMAATRARIPTGSAPWFVSESRTAAEIIAQDVEEFSYSVCNDMEWLNEHMAEVFAPGNMYERVSTRNLLTPASNVANVFKTPGKLRGKTPRTIRKRPAPGNRAVSRESKADQYSQH